MQIQKISALTVNRDNKNLKTKVQHKMSLPSEVKMDSVSFRGNGDDHTTGLAIVAATVAVGIAICVATSGAGSISILL